MDSEEFRTRLRTADQEGRRIWVYADIAKGFWRKRRRIVAAFLVMLYLILPWLRFNGLPVLQFDFIGQRLVLLGREFWPHELAIFIPLVLAFIIGLFAITSRFGRAWCGWACPQTVFMEFVYRPFEVLVEGRPGKRRLLDQQRNNFYKLKIKGLKWFIFILVSVVVANSFLAYFINSTKLIQVIKDGPFAHPGLFFLMVGVSAFFSFNFGWFREQMCSITCPYGRLQTLLTDRHSLLVGYDRKRGEPRGKKTDGDCIDCKRCVQVCPAGIDIRDGVQMECIQCMECSDACDVVMTGINKPLNLIGYTTEEKMMGWEKTKRTKRHRYYGIVCSILVMFAIYNMVNRTRFDVVIDRYGAVQFEKLPDGIANRVHVIIENKSRLPLDITVTPVEKDIQITTPLTHYPIDPGNKIQIIVFAKLPGTEFIDGIAKRHLIFTDSSGEKREVNLTLFGPQK